MAGLMEMQLHGWAGMYELLRSLPAEVVSKRGGPVKAALRKGANVFLKAEKANLRAVMGHQVDGEKVQSSGLLLKNLVTRRGKPPASGNGERYIVGPKRKTYQRKGGKPVTTLKTAQILEYSSEKQPAEPFIRPAFKAKASEAIRTVESDLIKSVNKIVTKLAQQNKGR